MLQSSKAGCLSVCVWYVRCSQVVPGCMHGTYTVARTAVRTGRSVSQSVVCMRVLTTQCWWLVCGQSVSGVHVYIAITGNTMHTVHVSMFTATSVTDRQTDRHTRQLHEVISPLTNKPQMCVSVTGDDASFNSLLSFFHVDCHVTLHDCPQLPISTSYTCI